MDTPRRCRAIRFGKRVAMACLRYAPPHSAAMQSLAIDIFDISLLFAFRRHFCRHFITPLIFSDDAAAIDDAISFRLAAIFHYFHFDADADAAILFSILPITIFSPRIISPRYFRFRYADFLTPLLISFCFTLPMILFSLI
jgi:hypothetical protein